VDRHRRHSPFGNNGYNPEGVRIGGEGKQAQARAEGLGKARIPNLDNTKELGTRNIKIALRRLRKFAREGSAEELDIDAPSRHRAAGLARHPHAPERRNAIKVLLFLDVGGSMDPFIKLCEELFSAATSEFKNLEFFYFHNCLYEGVWKDNRRRFPSDADLGRAAQIPA
jgi:uncharacterized protein with von Willebrand factor type A (vWA) domain